MLFRKERNALTVYVQPVVAVAVVTIIGVLVGKALGIDPSTLRDVLKAATTVVGLKP